jgi:hypothetical protein
MTKPMIRRAGADPYRPPVLARSNECAGTLAQISAIEKLRQRSATHRWFSGAEGARCVGSARKIARFGISADLNESKPYPARCESDVDLFL